MSLALNDAIIQVHQARIKELQAEGLAAGTAADQAARELAAGELSDRVKRAEQSIVGRITSERKAAASRVNGCQPKKPRLQSPKGVAK